MGNMSELMQRSIKDALKKVIRKLIDYSTKTRNDIVAHVITRLRRNYEALEATKPPLLPTRRYIHAAETVLRAIINLDSISNEYLEHRISAEELHRAIREYEEAVNRYRDITSLERIKTTLYMVLPPATLLTALVYQLLVTGITIPHYMLYFSITLIILSLLTILLKPVVSFIINAINSLALLSSVLAGSNNGVTLDTMMVIVLYTLTFITSTIYIHIIYVVSSKKNLYSVEKTMLTLLKSIGNLSQDKGASEKQEKTKDKENIAILEELKRYYRRIYGEVGEDLLKYRITLMLFNGIPEKEILKKLLSEIKDIREKEVQV